MCLPFYYWSSGFCLGGPVGAFIGSMAGGAAAGLATQKVIEAFTPKNLPQAARTYVEKRSFSVNKEYLHRFRRRPAVRESIDHIYFQVKRNEIFMNVTRGKGTALLLFWLAKQGQSAKYPHKPIGASVSNWRPFDSLVDIRRNNLCPCDKKGPEISAHGGYCP